MSSMTVVVKDLEEVQEFVRHIAKRAGDMTSVFRSHISPTLDDDWRERFASEGASHGSKWKPLAPYTLWRRARNPGGNRGGIGRDTDQMYNSLTKPGAAFRISQVSRDSLVRGTSRPFADRFNAVRPINSPLPDKTIERIADAVVGHLTGGYRAS